MNDEFCIIETNKKHGELLLAEMLEAGNFGHFDNRTKHVSQQHIFTHGIAQQKKNLRFLCYYPSEVIWSVPWKIWHYCWRKSKGFL